MINCYLPHSIPWQSTLAITTACDHWCGILDLYCLKSGEHTDNFQRYLTCKYKDTLDWTNEYYLDNSTAAMMFLFQNQPSSFHSTVPVPPSVLQNFTSLLTTYSIFLSNDLKDIEQVYHAPLNNRLIQTLHGKIDFYKAIFEHKRYICLIIVPVGLRRNIFAHYHPGTSGTHVGEYKALFQIRSRFFWSHLRKLIKE